MIKGACPGVKRRVITLRKSIFPQTSRKALEEIKLKFVDTSRCGTSSLGSSGWSGCIPTISGPIRRFLGPKRPFLLFAVAHLSLFVWFN